MVSILSLIHSLAVLYIALVASTTVDHTASFAEIVRRRDAGELDQELSAATNDNRLSKRHATFIPTNQVKLIYAEGTSRWTFFNSYIKLARGQFSRRSHLWCDRQL